MSRTFFVNRIYVMVIEECLIGLSILCFLTKAFPKLYFAQQITDTSEFPPNTWCYLTTIGLTCLFKLVKTCFYPDNSRMFYQN